MGCHGCAYGRLGGAQEGVDAFLHGDLRGQGGQAVGTPLRALRGMGVTRRIVRFHRTREGQVGQRVLMGAVNRGIVGKIGKTAQRGVQLCGAAAEQASTAGREQRVAAEQRLAVQPGDMAAGVPRHLQYRETVGKAVDAYAVALVPGVVNGGDGFARRAVDRGAVAIAQCGNAAGVVGVVVGDQDGCQAQAVGGKGGIDHRGLSRIHHHRTGAGAQQPDIVIAQGGKGDNVHARILKRALPMSILSLSDWLQTPLGRHLMAWEQASFDHAVSDIFGYHAVQIGLPEIDLLRANRMPFRLRSGRLGEVGVINRAEALPFASASLDLVVLPHVLEFSPFPHQVLREVERVLVPEGSVIVSSFNPYSLWGLRRLLARQGRAFPWRGQYLSPLRVRDWMTLLGMENETILFGCYVPAVRSQRWLERWLRIEGVGARWWPVCGATYLMHGVKRTHGMRLITPNWRDQRASARRAAPVTQRPASRSGRGEA